MDADLGRRRAIPERSHQLTLDVEGRTLVERLGGRWTPKGGMCCCPAHVDRTPSLSIRPGRSRLLLHCFAGCAATDILRALASAGLLVPTSASRGDGLPREADAISLSGAALRLWGAATRTAGTPAQAYLASRGIRTSSPELRFLHRTPHGPKPLTRYRPALVAAVRDGTGLVAVHRTFLDVRPARLARLAEPRCGLGRFGRGAVRLGGVAATLGLAEGIETALSATALFGIPCWATLGTERFGLVALPDHVTELLLFLDNDQGGRRAERLACAAYTQVPSIQAHYPPSVGDDWNDVLRASVLPQRTS